MSRKNVLIHELKVNNSTAISLASSFISEPTVITYMDNISFQINLTTSDSVGSFTIQGSDDYDVSQPGTAVVNAGNWVDLPLSGTPNANGANDTILVDMRNVPFVALRLVYTSSVAGTGTATAYIVAKQVGG